MAVKEVRICENCGTGNPVSNLECAECGYDLSFIIPTSEQADINYENIFLQNNDKSQWILISQKDSNYTVELNEVTEIGRECGPLKEYLDNSDYISRIHAKIISEKGDLYVIDCSTNGTFINEKRIEKMKKIKIGCGDLLRFADTTFIVGKVYADR